MSDTETFDRTAYMKSYRQRNKERDKTKNLARKNAWRKLNPEKVLAQRKRNYQKNKSYYQAKRKEYRKLYPNRKYPPSLNGRFSKYKRSAIERNYSFELTLEQFDSLLKEKVCYYCGDTENQIGLDRVINSEGYLIDNVVPCCWSCNKLKGALDGKEFVKICIKISNSNRLR